MTYVVPFYNFDFNLTLSSHSSTGVALDTEYPSLFANTTVAVVAPLTAPTQVAVIDPIPAAPALWQSEKTLPAAMFPTVDCIPAATEPAATPLGEKQVSYVKKVNLLQKLTCSSKSKTL